MKNASPRYRGVAIGDVARSVGNAETLLRSLNLGPEATALLDRWAAPKACERMEAAKTDAEAVEAVRRSQASDVLLEFCDVLRFHAALNTGGTARANFKVLQSWGAFTGFLRHGYSQLNEEQDVHILRQAFGRAATRRDPAETKLEKACAIAFGDPRATYKPEFIAEVKQVLGHVLSLRKADVEEAVAFFLGKETHVRNAIKDALVNLSGNDAKMPPQGIGPFRKYGIAFPELSRGSSWEDMGKAAEPLMPRLHDVLKPYVDRDEVMMGLGIGLGCITRDGSRMGLIFDMTPGAARAVAAAFPDQAVIDGEGRPVKAPRRSGPAPAPGG